MGKCLKSGTLTPVPMAFAILPSQSLYLKENMWDHMVKIQTFDAAGFWRDAYAHQRGKLLKKVQVPDDQIIILVNKRYQELDASLRYDIETSGVSKKELQ